MLTFLSSNHASSSQSHVVQQQPDKCYYFPNAGYNITSLKSTSKNKTVLIHWAAKADILWFIIRTVLVEATSDPSPSIPRTIICLFIPMLIFTHIYSIFEIGLTCWL